MVRLKHRYLLVHILYPEGSGVASAPSNDSGILPDRVRFHAPTPDAITPASLLGEIREAVAALYGDYGAGVAGMQLNIKYFSNATSTFILRCPRAPFRLVWAALAMMTALTVPGSKESHNGGAAVRQTLRCVMRVAHVSGTIRKAEEAAIKAARESIRLATAAEAAGGSSTTTGWLHKLLPERAGGKEQEDEDESDGGSSAAADVTMGDEESE